LKESFKKNYKAKYTYDFEGNLLEIRPTVKTSENPVQITKIKLKTQNSNEKNKEFRKSNKRIKKLFSRSRPKKKKNNFLKKRQISFLKDGKKIEKKN
jgi:hypothetical protein